MWKLRGVNSL